jgi:hypothetical protein
MPGNIIPTFIVTVRVTRGKNKKVPRAMLTLISPIPSVGRSQTPERLYKEVAMMRI